MERVEQEVRKKNENTNKDYITTQILSLSYDDNPIGMQKSSWSLEL